MNKVSQMIGKGWTHQEALQRSFYVGWIASAGLLEFDMVTMTILSILNDSFVFFTRTCKKEGFREDHI